VTRVGYHAFHTYERHPGRDGANRAYEEIGRLLSDETRLDVVPHDIRSLLDDEFQAIRVLGACDVVVASVGPHAHFYHFLRQKHGLSFRIVRDVRTALWNGYLLQECLTSPLSRAEDSVIHSSAYSRDLFTRLLGNSMGERLVCYPLMRWFPPQTEVTARGRRPRNKITVGYVGRLTDDKGFPEALALLNELCRRNPGKFRLVAVGEGSPPYGSAAVSRSLTQPALSAYSWRPAVTWTSIWECYRDFDVLFFPSTSTLETLGRVLVEAMYSGLPVVASEHGATSELLDPKALIKTTYDVTRDYSAHFAAPLASVDIQQAADLIADESFVASEGHWLYRDDAARFAALLAGGNGSVSSAMRPGTVLQRSFIDRVEASDLTRPINPEEAMRAIGRLIGPFLRLNGRGVSRLAMLGELTWKSRHRRKTIEFARRAIGRGEDFTNIGGVDLQLSHLLQFYPWFRIAPDGQEGASA